jgi:hypothetical protein
MEPESDQSSIMGSMVSVERVCLHCTALHCTALHDEGGKR